jgi:hypothetical protein
MRKSRHIVFGVALAAALAIFFQAFQLPASAADHVIRIGYQKYGNFILLKGTGELEKKLAPKGYTVEWTEFPSGPPLLEAVNAGAIAIGQAKPRRFLRRPPLPTSSISRMSRRRRRAKRSWCQKTARSHRSLS